MIGFGENIGSGFPTILEACKKENWRRPLLSERPDLYLVELTLSMISLILSECETQLLEIYGDDMLEKAAPRLTDKGTMLHSDQGVLYRTAGYRELLAEHSMVQSMLRKANCWDNAPMESFFAVLKTECFYNAGELTVDELMKQIDDYMDYYNRERCSLKLKKLSPVAYRTQLAQLTA